MKNKILSFMLAVCMIIPAIFCLSACKSNDNGEDNNANVALLQTQETFYRELRQIDKGLENVSHYLIGDTPITKYCQIKYATGTSGMLHLYRNEQGDSFIINEYSGQIMSQYDNEDDRPNFALTNNMIENYIEMLRDAKFASYNGYYIDLSSNKWDKDNRGPSFDYGNEDIFFYKDNYDFLSGDYFSSYNIKNYNLYNESNLNETFMDLNLFVIDEGFTISDGIVYHDIWGGTLNHIEEFSNLLQNLIINENIELINSSCFLNRTLLDITIDSEHVASVLFDNEFFSGTESLINNMANATTKVYVKKGLNMSSNSQFYNLFTKELTTDKSGYDMWVKR